MRMGWVLAYHGVDRDSRILELARRMVSRGRALRD
jgi:hypothetical protein